MAAQKLDPSFKIIDDALANYWIRLGRSNYLDSDGIGLFLKYIIDEELNDPDSPIEKELGDDCDPNNCTYSWMNNDIEFPIPLYAEIPDKQKETFIYYILQYCYKYKQAPSDQYIESTIVPQCGGTINNTVTTAQMRTNQNDNGSIESPTPMTFTEEATMHDIDIKQSDTIEYDEEIPQSMSYTKGIDEDTKEREIIRVTKTEFEPKYQARAHLNIYTSKELTKELSDIIEEEFGNDSILYYYTDISTVLQINDHQMVEFTVSINGNEEKLSVINYDLHFKGRNEYLYGVIVPNDKYKIKQDKWLWKLDEFLTADGILKKYNITKKELPQSSRLMPRFQRQISETLVIEEKLIDNTDWFGVQQIKSLKRNIKLPKITITLSKEMWIIECKKSFQNVDLPLIPVVVNKNKKHWIEWIKIINIKSQNIYAGISCKYDENNKKWSVESICLDRSDIYNKHRLVGLKRDKYSQQLKEFKTSITEIRFSDNESKDIDKKMNVLKQQIRSQQESIVRLKESLLRAKNANKYIINGNNDTFENGGDDEKEQLIQQHIKEFVDEECEDDHIEKRLTRHIGDEWLDQHNNTTLIPTQKGMPQSMGDTKESLLRPKTANKYIINDNNDTLENADDDEKGEFIQQHIKEFIDQESDDDDGVEKRSIKHIGDECCQIVGDVTKKYDVLDLQMTPIGAERNIYIDKQFIKSWMNEVTPRFNDEAMMYYWLDYTTAIQMIQKYAKQYVNKENRNFIVAVIEYELTDNSNNILYGIILCDDEKTAKTNDKYPYKLKTLMTKQQIHDKYGINQHDLPKKSRTNSEFINKLLLKRGIVRDDLNKINWSNLNNCNKNTNNKRFGIPQNKIYTFFRGYARKYLRDGYQSLVECCILHYTDLLERTISKRDLKRMNSTLPSTNKAVMRKYCHIALERNNMLTPIVVTDKYNNCVIEYVLIVRIVHEQRDVGIGFRYNEKTDVFIDTTIYLDKGEIESKHKLIGLKFEDCKHLKPFSLTKFEFKSDRNTIIDEDADSNMQIRNNNGHYQQMQHQLAKYKKMYEAKQLENRHLEQQIQNTNQMYLTQIKALKQEQQNIMNQQQMQQQQQQQQNVAAYQYGWNNYGQKYDGYI